MSLHFFIIKLGENLVEFKGVNYLVVEKKKQEVGTPKLSIKQVHNTQLKNKKV